MVVGMLRVENDVRAKVVGTWKWDSEVVGMQVVWPIREPLGVYVFLKASNSLTNY